MLISLILSMSLSGLGPSPSEVLPPHRDPDCVWVTNTTPTGPREPVLRSQPDGGDPIVVRESYEEAQQRHQEWMRNYTQGVPFVDGEPHNIEGLIGLYECQEAIND